MTLFLMAFLTGVFEGIWRRLFGSDSWCLGAFNNRAFKHILGGVALFEVFFLYKGVSWYTALYTVIVIQALFWAPGHGPVFDIGRAGMPDASVQKRYEQLKGYSLLNKWFFAHKYSVVYDMAGMCLRYMWPTLFLAPVLGGHVLCLGIIVAAVYTFMWQLYEVEYTQDPTEWAEGIAGFIVGFMLVIGG